MRSVHRQPQTNTSSALYQTNTRLPMTPALRPYRIRKNVWTMPNVSTLRRLLRPVQTGWETRELGVLQGQHTGLIRVERSSTCVIRACRPLLLLLPLTTAVSVLGVYRRLDNNALIDEEVCMNISLKHNCRARTSNSSPGMNMFVYQCHIACKACFGHSCQPSQHMTSRIILLT